MIPLAVPNLTGNEARYLKECIESTFVSSVGPFVTRFEELIAASTNTSHVVCTPSGTTGLHLALVSLGVKQNDLVILPSFTFIASANAISYCHATPWLADISNDSWSLDPELFRKMLEENTLNKDGSCFYKPTGQRVAAVMPVHVLGQPADMFPLVEIAREFNLAVVADGAAALGATYHNQKLGTCGADLLVLSFNGNKTITAGGGGAICGNDADVMSHLRHLATTARIGDAYDHDEIGYNYRMTNIEAAVGCAQIERLEEFVNKKREIRQYYESRLLDLPGISSRPVIPGFESADWFSVLVIDPAVLGDPSVIRRQLRTMGVDSRPFWKPIHLQKPYLNAPRTGMDVSENLWDRIITLPCSTNITQNEQDTVIASFIKAVEQ